VGARAYRYLSLYDPAPGVLVEIGSERGEGSTVWLSRYAKRCGLRFYTADIDPDTHRAARRITPGARLARGRDLLRKLRSPVSVAYLDGFDWIPQGREHVPWIADQRARYHELGYHLTNEDCQHEHLHEAKALAERAADRCAVIADDTWLDENEWTGKGGLAVPYLIGEGFEVVDHAGCQDESLGYVVMRRG
jgi:hypothetical protein